MKKLISSFLLFFCFTRCDSISQTGENWRTGNLDKLSQLSLRLNAKFDRGLEKNPYSLSYKPIEPNTIIIKVRFKSETDEALARDVAKSAKTHAENYAEREFGLKINTDIDIKPLSTTEE